ncbi:MAG: glucoamylase family protein [Bdellovibrionota bacterium]
MHKNPVSINCGLKLTIISVVFGIAMVFFVPCSAIAIERINTRTEMAAQIKATALRYFLENAHPVTGLVRDKAQNFSPTTAANDVASMAATGFGLAIVSHASLENKIPREKALTYVKKTLKFSLANVPRHRGWFLHWVNWNTGKRTWDSEYSTIDTALFVAGALYAVEVFQDQELRDLVFKIYDEMDFFAFLTDDGKKPNKKTLSLSYRPESGYSSYQWQIYSEHMILLILGIGKLNNPLPVQTWTAWNRLNLPMNLNLEMAMGYPLPLFIHQYSHLFFDFRKMNDGFPNYFQNSVKVSQKHRLMANGSGSTETFRAGFWGLSAGEDVSGYAVYSPLQPNATVCIGCAIGSAMFIRNEVLNDALKWHNGIFGNRIWGRYGFVDSINLEQKWFSPMVLGITVGPAYMSVANTEANPFWDKYMKNPAFTRALQRIQKNR